MRTVTIQLIFLTIFLKLAASYIKNGPIDGNYPPQPPLASRYDPYSNDVPLTPDSSEIFSSKTTESNARLATSIADTSTNQQSVETFSTSSQSSHETSSRSGNFTSNKSSMLKSNQLVQLFYILLSFIFV
ncbi:hypothetical protein KGF54_001846 [Candida jiufengensis]|uniref:uncharacterized protein n=1 Tax=Candida jiufengensis TaxID=497108 RepID=UPI002224AD4E|nr:uncharacterized protein KGF54_001846 [Candida jiufengensis]KAI5955285.1 hypothetical protein KGF54_001846 [Candida jiufengensis]